MKMILNTSEQEFELINGLFEHMKIEDGKIQKLKKKKFQQIKIIK